MTKRPAIPQPPHKGGCICGEVRYRLDARPMAANACHCDACKKLTGATNLLMIVGPREKFVAEGSTDRYRRTAESGRQVDIVRCKNCGVRMWHEPLAAPHLVFIAVGTLDDPSWVVPASHIWVEKASPGVLFQDDAIKVEGQPKERELLFDAFAKLYPDAH